MKIKAVARVGMTIFFLMVFFLGFLKLEDLLYGDTYHDMQAAKAAEIVEPSRIGEEERRVLAAPVMVEVVAAEETPEEDPEPEAETEPTEMYYDEADIVKLAKVLYRECRGLGDTEKACVAWVVCNRVDAGGDFAAQDTVSAVIEAPYQFAYIKDTPIWESLYYLAEDVLQRWNAEKNGQTDVGRVLPSEYLFFHGDGSHNYFRKEYQGDGQYWDYSLDSPYES